MPTTKDKLQAIVNLQKDLEDKELKQIQDNVEAQEKARLAAIAAGTPKA